MLRRLLSRRLLMALAVSVLVHLWLVGGTELSLPDWEAQRDRIEVTLAPPPPKPKPVAPVKAPEPPAPKPAVKKPRERPIPPPEPPKPVVEPPAEPVAAAPVAPAALLEPPAPPPPTAMEPLPPVEEEPPPVITPPKRVEIEFSGFNGGKGRGRQTFELLADGHYRLTAEMSMPVLLFISGSIEQSSEGLVTASGLQPLTFRQKTTGGKPQTANFDWSASKVKLDTGKRVDDLDLPPGTQDFISFMYQFMFVPPLQDMRINMITGKKLRTYLYEFEGEETLNTKMGPLRTVHIGRSTGDGEEKTELWLAMDHRHLPVRIRKTEKDGAAIDLVANRLEITE